MAESLDSKQHERSRGAKRRRIASPHCSLVFLMYGCILSQTVLGFGTISPPKSSKHTMRSSCSTLAATTTNPLAPTKKLLPHHPATRTRSDKKKCLPTSDDGMHTGRPLQFPVSSPRYLPRLDDEEHEQCLQDVLELRRIRSVLKAKNQKRQSSPQYGGGGIVLTLQQSHLCGYGDDITAFEAAIDAGERSREKLITNHMGLVHSVVKEICNKRKLHSLKQEDLVQEGVIGLARALEKYEPNKFNTKLSTYSVFWIRAVVLRAIAEKDSAVYIPSHIQQTAARLYYHHQHQQQQHQHYWEEAIQAKKMAESLGVSDRHLQEAMKVQKRQFMSIEDLTRERDLMDHSVTEQHQQQQYGMDLTYMKKVFSMFLGPREVEALSWRYGLNDQDPDTTNSDVDVVPRSMGSRSVGGRWGEAMSFSEVGQQMHISAEYGRRLCHRALKKLQQAVKEGNLELAVLMP